MGRQDRARLAALLFVVGSWSLPWRTCLAQVSPENSHLPPIVHVARKLDLKHDPASTPGAVERAEWGRLQVLSDDKTIRILVDGSQGDPALPVDVQEPCVSWDASRIVFSGLNLQEGGWRIYEIDADGSRLHQVTRAEREVDLSRFGAAGELLAGHDDVAPCYLPDGRICFVSTRYPEVAPDGRARASNLYVTRADGTETRRITTERFGADTPTVDPVTGRIVYSRWWRTLQVEKTVQGPGDEARVSVIPPAIPPGGHYGPQPGPGDSPGKVVAVTPENVSSSLPLRGLDDNAFSGVNSWFLATIRPDGGDLAMRSGFRLNREQTQAYRPRILESGEAVSLFVFETPFLGFPVRSGIRTFKPGPGKPTAVAGPQTFQAGVNPKPRDRLLAASVEALTEDSYLVTGFVATDGPSRSTNKLYILPRENDLPQLLHESPGLDLLDAVPLRAKKVPPVLPDVIETVPTDDVPRTAEEAYSRGTFKFMVENIHANGPVDFAVATAPPVGRNLEIEFYMAPQLSRGFPADPPLLLASREIGPGGKLEIDLPAGVPLFEVLRRPDGSLAQGRDGQVFHVGGLNFGAVGAEARCVGCHAGHTMLDVESQRIWTNLAPSAQVTASSRREDLIPFFDERALVDRKTDPITAEWCAADKAPQTYLRLTWPVPLVATSVKIYGPKPGEGLLGPRAQQIKGLTLETQLGPFRSQKIRVTETLSPSGTEVPLDASREFDQLTLTIEGRNVEGAHESSDAPALAEIEVIARVAREVPPQAYYIRGDANCDTAVNVSDAVAMLGNLFQGSGPACCAEAMDVNADGAMDLTDPVALLSHLFRGTAQPTHPFPGCGVKAVTTLGCGQESCR